MSNVSGLCPIPAMGSLILLLGISLVVVNERALCGLSDADGGEFL